MQQDFVESAIKLKEAFIKSLLNREDKLDETYLLSPNGQKKCSWSRRELAEEIQNDTDMGLGLMVDMMNLAAHMISKDKSLNK